MAQAAPPPLSADEDQQRIRAGVRAGIISQDQANALFQLPLDEREESFIARRTGDEPFSLFRGFRDVFLALGLLILGVGLGATVGEVFGLDLGIRTGWRDALILLGLAAVAWVLAEWVTAQLRMPLASLVLCTAFSLSLAASIAAALYAANLISYGFASLDGLASILIALGGLAFYLRFRLPFAMLLIGGALTYWIFSQSFDTFTNPTPARWLALGLGLLLLTVALTYELLDPKRIARFSENAFWLHLLSAPLIVFALTGGRSGFFPDFVDVFDAQQAALIFAMVAGLAIVALLIDRRVFIVSALLYLAGAIGYAINQTGLDATMQFASTALILGALVVGLALGWQPLRRAFIGLLPSQISQRLPNPIMADRLGN